MWINKTGCHIKNKEKEKVRYDTSDMYTGSNNFNAKIGTTFSDKVGAWSGKGKKKEVRLHSRILLYPTSKLVNKWN